MKEPVHSANMTAQADLIHQFQTSEWSFIIHDLDVNALIMQIIKAVIFDGFQKMPYVQ